MSNLEVINDRFCDRDDTRGEDGPYTGHCEEYWDNNIKGLRLVSKQSFCDVYTDFDIARGDEVYLVYGIYNSGDSFSNVRGLIEYIAVYKTLEKANKAREQLEYFTNVYDDSCNRSYGIKKNKSLPDWNEDFQVNVETESGEQIPYKGYGVPWIGYFESLQDIYVEKHIVR